MNPELTYVQEAADILKHHGRVFIGYITAELEPYSARQKPDISFIPNAGPNAGDVFFVEVRLRAGVRLPKDYLGMLREHRAFAEEGAEQEYAGFAIATDTELDPDAIRALNDRGVHYLGPVNSGVSLAEKIIEWVSART